MTFFPKLLTLEGLTNLPGFITFAPDNLRNGVPTW